MVWTTGGREEANDAGGGGCDAWMETEGLVCWVIAQEIYLKE